MHDNRLYPRVTHMSRMSCTRMIISAHTNNWSLYLLIRRIDNSMRPYEELITLSASHYSYERIQSLWLADTIIVTTGWRRLIGSPKLQIIFHKRATKYRSLLRKMTCKDKGSYGSSPPCTMIVAYVADTIIRTTIIHMTILRMVVRMSRCNHCDSRMQTHVALYPWHVSVLQIHALHCISFGWLTYTSLRHVSVS